MSAKAKNYYEIIGSGYNDMKGKNPAYGKRHFMQLFWRAIIVGKSGSGKTNCLLELIESMPKTFNHIVLIAPSIEQPLYKWLQDRLGDLLLVYDFPPPLQELIDMNLGQALVIFDDLQNDKRANEIIQEYFIRSRHAKMCCVYLAQNYYGIPTKIRGNSDYVFIKQVATKKDLKRIWSEYNIEMKFEPFHQLYMDSSKKMENSIMISKDGAIYLNFTDRRG